MADRPPNDSHARLPAGLRYQADGLAVAPRPERRDLKKALCLGAGVALFALVYLSPPWRAVTDPQGCAIPLTAQGKAALALFLLVIVWWVTEAIPIGVTGIAIGVAQVLFAIRPAKSAFGDFMDPSVSFILGSIVIGIAFTRTGLATRMAYRMLAIVGERTTLIYGGCFLMTALLTLIMAHTAVAATVFPLLMAIHALYADDSKPTRFGKGLFMGMAFTAGAGSIVTLLGSARAAVAISFFKDIAGRDVSFFKLTYYMLPLGFLMVLLLWAYVAVVFRPERRSIPGLRDRARALCARLGPMSRHEWGALTIVLLAVLAMGAQSFVPALASFHKSGVILLATVLFFVFDILDLDDLESIPWNIILLFGGAMSIGFCLWETGAAQWLAVNWLGLFGGAPRFVFIMAIALFVLLLTNFIMNVAAIAVTVPVAMVMARYLGVAPDVVLFAALAAAGMPFLLLIGAAPNAIAYGSRQFTSWEFFRAGLPATALLIAVLGAFVAFVWPTIGMPVAAP